MGCGPAAAASEAAGPAGVEVGDLCHHELAVLQPAEGADQVLNKGTQAEAEPGCSQQGDKKRVRMLPCRGPDPPSPIAPRTCSSLGTGACSVATASHRTPWNHGCCLTPWKPLPATPVRCIGSRESRPWISEAASALTCGGMLNCPEAMLRYI